MKLASFQVSIPNLPHTDLGSATHTIIEYIVYIAGILSVIFVLVGAFQYVTSGGNPDATRRAKDTIMYALIGLVVTSIAFALVKFVFGRLA